MDYYHQLSKTIDNPGSLLDWKSFQVDSKKPHHTDKSLLQDYFTSSP